MHSNSSTPTKFDNNNDIKKSIEKMSDSSKSSYQAIKSTESLQPTKKSKKKTGIHLNNLWSIWYGIFCTALQAYAAYKCLKRILGYSILPWPEGLPYLELNCSLGLTGAALLLLPMFLAVAILKVGNLANDGYKLGRQMGMCSKESPELLKSGGCGLFRYGGPTAPFIHIAISFCLLIPKLLMEAKLIEAGFLDQVSLQRKEVRALNWNNILTSIKKSRRNSDLNPIKDTWDMMGRQLGELPFDLNNQQKLEQRLFVTGWIWHTDLDFIIVRRDRMVVLNFLTTNNSNTLPASIIQTKVAQPTMASIKPTAMPFVSGTAVTHTVIKTLKDIIGHDNHTAYDNKNIETGWGSPVSIEYMNLALALVIYSVRYPALFWSTNKCLGLIFSFQLLINGLHTLISFAGMSILYKVHVFGAWKALPLLKPNRVYNFGNPTPFLLNSQVTFAMYILSTLLVLASSIVLYFYGHTSEISYVPYTRGTILLLKAYKGASPSQIKIICLKTTALDLNNRGNSKNASRSGA
ncbi:hypothetical protein NQ317_017644 [Molorchus minor]|uniref:Uncharacterized protein n=1 Tax=Molorchus minor TaxID=1323400 RepID=A0ABQ9JJR7_9CUCU|nr:hypothetical protein NQ317_017644 [Molorchus minor]